MSSTKRQVRQAFRDAVFKRAKYRCEGPGCGFASTREKAETELDAHHITDRHEMPGGGYVAANGIALCARCHDLAEVFHSTGAAHPGYAPEDLYAIIGGSRATAEAAALRATC